MKRPLYIMVDLTGQTAFARGVIAGVARFCHEHPEVKLRFPTIEWELVGDPESVDGVIAVVAADDVNHAATRFKKPVVNVSSICHPVPFPTVTIDNRAAGRLAAEHLLQQGYRHFGYHMESRVYYSRQRYAGFREFLEKKGHECHVFDTAPFPTPPIQVSAPASTLNLESPAEMQSQSRSQTLQWLQGLPKPLGLFTHNDVRASMLIDICRQANLAVPDQIGVMGVDNDELVYPFSTPPLTDIDTAPDVIGYHAAELLLDLIGGKAPPRDPILIAPRRLFERPSTQPQFIDDEYLATAMQMIRRNAASPPSIEDILAVVPLSRRSLERRFRDRVGSSPAREIRRIQLNKAKELLLNTTQSLPRIALAAGYARFRNFATAFKKETGVTPSAFRRKFKA